MAFMKIGVLLLMIYSGSQITAASKMCTSKYSPCYFRGVGCGSGEYCFAINCLSDKSLPNTCYPAPSCVSFKDNFTNATDLVMASTFDGNPNSGPRWMSQWKKNYASIEDGQLVLGMKSSGKKHNGNLVGFGSTVVSVRWMLYGNVTARVKSASVTGGVVSSFIIKNPEGDEIDFEWVGGNPNMVQTDYYYDGIKKYMHDGREVYGHAKNASVGSDTSAGFNEYMIQWEEELINFWVNKKIVRTVLKKDTYNHTTKTFQYPARPAPVQLSIWDSNEQGKYTIDWAGGPTDWSKPNTEYKVYFESIDMQCKHSENLPWDPPKIPTLTSTSMPASKSPTSTVEASLMSSSTYSTIYSPPTHISNSKTHPTADKSVGSAQKFNSIFMCATLLFTYNALS
ncbi:concanavalin A-like lectin/glucanase [Basidiobolus meristosporus CBS 931.73]|uniref:Concanavalin A-like lectin/glucanase n=1 Tax=Basidiobolus meristosporus CBS 931.73 TaxID=1314790 RepID=A0A1Y1YEY2_9FUNG|nr:concanavalin A-like lectin/glucanase [Basidiobolus meristosporus CBS 931.73]|eukprot:ORX96493.1 concanavalin A-like lectin/glucanase [Basidiobolus meristosporus CBS 931.73]